MEPETTIPVARPSHVGDKQQRGKTQGSSVWRHEPREANPPVGTLVLEQLATSLTLPHTPAASRAESTELKSDPALSTAYGACTDIIKRHSKSFYFSARLLPAQKRKSIMSLYAFCRISDDLVDAADASGEDRVNARQMARASLDGWGDLLHKVEQGVANSVVREENSSDAPQTIHSAVAEAWIDTRVRHGIPSGLADELLAGVRMDLSISRYETWNDLWLYCYRVASTVGLMSMYIMSAKTMDAVPYAVQLGVALQLTNILRDVGEDARAGRIYLPAEDMARFGYTEEMLMSGAINRPFINLMNFQIARARALYRSSMPGIALLSPDSRLAVMAAAKIYRGILDKIIVARYDVFTHRAHLTAGEKVRSLPAIWWQSHQLGFRS